MQYLSSYSYGTTSLFSLSYYFHYLSLLDSNSLMKVISLIKSKTLKRKIARSLVSIILSY